MQILAAHDPEDKQLDPVEPLGSISIRNEGNELTEDCVWLDEWFGGLVSGLQGAGLEERRIGLDSAPDPLIWEPNSTGAILRYRTKELRLPDLRVFEEALGRAIIEFTEPYTNHKNWVRCKGLLSVREWAMKNKAG